MPSVKKKRDFSPFPKCYREYGLTVELFEAIVEACEGSCCICSTSAKETNGRRLVIDHDHKAVGRVSVRGLLCLACNAKVGSIENFGYEGCREQWVVPYETYLANCDPARFCDGIPPSRESYNGRCEDELAYIEACMEYIREPFLKWSKTS
jgi:hypothetical protein